MKDSVSTEDVYEGMTRWADMETWARHLDVGAGVLRRRIREWRRTVSAATANRLAEDLVNAGVSVYGAESVTGVRVVRPRGWPPKPSREERAEDEAHLATWGYV